MIPRMKTTLFQLLLILIAIPSIAAQNNEYRGLETVAHLPPGEQFRQLSLMLLMSAKAGPEFVALLRGKQRSNDLSENRGDSGIAVKPDDYRTPLVRIVDQESMLRGAVHLFDFAYENLERISQDLHAIKSENPVLISMVDTHAIMEDAIIIRSAIADSVFYLDYAEDEQLASFLGAYRVHTVFLRNEMEFAEFYQELERLTDEAVNSVGGKMDAYQRMFDDESDSSSIEHYIMASEFSSEKRTIFDRRAGIMTEEIMKSVMDAQTPAKP